MRRVDDPSDFDPRGGWYLLRDRFLVWRLDSGLEGSAAWGPATTRDALDLVELLELAAARRAVPAAGIVDLSRLESMDEGVLGVFDAFLRRHQEAFAAGRTAEAVIRPAGLMGAIAAGAYDVLPHDFPTKTFVTFDVALRWLGRADAEGALREMMDELDRRASEPGLLRRLHDALHEARFDADLDQTASRLKMPRRTLQHHLTAAGTTFREELARARIERAKVLLGLPDRKIATIAYELGYSSPGHFSSWFKRVVGVSPGEYRPKRER